MKFLESLNNSFQFRCSSVLIVIRAVFVNICWFYVLFGSTVVGWCVVTPVVEERRLRRGSWNRKLPSAGSSPLPLLHPLVLSPNLQKVMIMLMDSYFFSRKMFIGGLSWQTSPGKKLFDSSIIDSLSSNGRNDKTIVKSTPILRLFSIL